MFHLEQGCVKSCSARAIYTNARGRKGEVDISVSLARVQADPAVCALLSVCWLMKWTRGLGNWFWLRLISLFLFCLARWSASCVHSALTLTPHPSPHFSSLPLGQLVFPHLLAHTDIEGWSQNVWEGGERNKVGYLVLSVVSYLTRCLSAKLRHHFWLSFASFILPASKIICLFFENFCNLLI